MKDAIDKRNEKEEIARGVVKRRNIVYISQEELERRRMEEEKSKKSQEERELAEKIARQLREDEDKKKAMEIERLLAERAVLEKQLETGMDATGKKPMSDVTQERVEAILSEKSKQLQDLIAANSMVLEQKNKPVEASDQEDLKTDEPEAEANDLAEDISVEKTDAETDTEIDMQTVPEAMEASPELEETDIEAADANGSDEIES